MKRVISVIMVLTVLMMGGIGMAEKLTTVEEFLRKADMNIDSIADTSAIEEFIKERDLDPYIFEELPNEIVKRYAEALLNDMPISYTDVIDNHLSKSIENVSCNDATIIAASIMEDARILSLVIDKRNSVAYFSFHGYIIDDVCYAEKKISLTEEMFDKVVDQLMAENVMDFDREYTGDESVRTAAQLVIGFDIGSITYSVRGANSNVPNKYWEMCDWLFNYLSGIDNQN